MVTSPHGLTRRNVLALGSLILLGSRFRQAAGQEPGSYTFAVLGLDTREENADQRADSIMVSRVDLDALSVRTLSIPRDLYVEIPGYGYGKINDAYQRGLASDPDLDWRSGAAVTVDTINHNFGVTCDGSAVLELQRLPEVIDTVSGVEVDNPYRIYVPDFPEFAIAGTRVLDFPEGPIVLDGASAMDYVRTRQQDGDGGRVMRQHLMLAALLAKLQQPEMIPRIPNLVDELRDVVHTDIDTALQLRLIGALPQIPLENLAFTNIDRLLTSGYTEGGAWVYQADWTTLPAYVQAWLAGDAI
jgi:polyisoprenyl-teichoic acid--peptidoglycan teichoic acid transferase